ncbi:25S rRNA (adenine(2142)-N(1))-methyltransferase-like isoform X2 [Anneissia japonica]|nr:25S rRNA (adenine(2142)-N(1))-methyltransferase-like isoform X2 [Anneissia japonica]
MKLIAQELEQVGGIDTYQATSSLGEFKNGRTNSAKWVVAQLKEHRIKSTTSAKLRLLDVGALHLNYAKQKWIDSTAIDINPTQPGILKADFFDLKVKPSDAYDVIVLSLVLNFVGSPHRRGEMLQKCHRFCKKMGYLVIVLPLACVTNSRYLTHDHLVDIMDSLGFTLISSHNSRKLSYKMFQLTEESMQKTFKKQIVNKGTKCNNFSIVIR